MIGSLKVITALLATSAVAAQQMPNTPESEQIDAVETVAEDTKPKFLKGACPELKGTISQRKDAKLEHKRLLGRWKTAYESKHRMRGMKCLQLKFQEVEGGQPHQLQGLAGQKIVAKEGDFTEGKLFKENEQPGFYYDAESYFNFGHPEKKALAAVQTREDLFDLDRSKMRKHVDDQMRDLTYEEKERMMPDEVQRYETTQNYIKENYDRIMKDIKEYDPYKQNYEVLDTDYDNFLYLYTCKQYDMEVNSEGQTRDAVEDLKQKDLQSKLFLGEQAKRTIHMYLNTMGGNKKFVKFVQIIQQQLAKENGQSSGEAESLTSGQEERKTLTDAQLQKELDFFLGCDESFKHLFFEARPTLDAWKIVRRYFDYYVQQEMEAGMDAHADGPQGGEPIEVAYEKDLPADAVDRSDLPTYDEDYHTETQHQLSVSIFVRNLQELSDEKYNEHLTNLKSILEGYEAQTVDHERVYHDPEACPAEDVDPFLMAGSQSFTTALGIEDKTEEIRSKPIAEEFNDFYNLDPEDVDGFGASGIDNGTREL